MQNENLTAKKIGAKLRYFRIKNNMTLNEVGERLGMSGASISYYENGKRKLTPDLIVKLCKIYNIMSVSAFYGDFAEFAEIPGVTKSEHELLERWRVLNDEQQKAILLLISDLTKT